MLLPSALIPQHYFRTLCQYEACKTPLGGFHVPSVGGTVVFACHSCRRVSLFRIETHQTSGYLIDPKTGAVLDKRTGRPPASTEKKS